MYVVGLGETKVEIVESCASNPYGFACRKIKSGSMMQQIMMDYAIQVKHLPSDLGKDKNLVILLVDEHVSRWDAVSLLYFMNNNVFIFILALHNSVWYQPNNNVPNLRIYKCVEKAVTRLGMRYKGEKVKHSYFNIIMRHT